MRIRKINTSGIITTIAGNANAGDGGDGGPAVDATLDMPGGLAFDANGNLYVADGRVNKIRVVDANGIMHTFAGTGISGSSGDGGAAANARLNIPEGVAVDDNGSVLIADVGNHKIRKVDPLGVISTIAGTGFPGFSGDGGLPLSAEFYYPTSVFCRGNQIYISDCWNNRIRKIDMATTVSSEHYQLNWELYPNPNYGAFTVTGISPRNTKVLDFYIIDIVGRTILHEREHADNSTVYKQFILDKNIPAGHYFLNINTSNEFFTMGFDKL